MERIYSNCNKSQMKKFSFGREFSNLLIDTTITWKRSIYSIHLFHLFRKRRMKKKIDQKKKKRNNLFWVNENMRSEIVFQRTQTPASILLSSSSILQGSVITDWLNFTASSRYQRRDFKRVGFGELLNNSRKAFW